MSRDGEHTVLAFVGDGETIEVTETPEQILDVISGQWGRYNAKRRHVIACQRFAQGTKRRSNPFAAYRIASLRSQ